MDSCLKIKKSAEQGLSDFLKSLLEKNEVSGLFTLRKSGVNHDFDYGLITDTQMMKDAIPLHPFMPVNAAQELSRFTGMRKPIAVVIKPCELRAFVELVKRSQGNLEQFLIISYTCGGVFRFEATTAGKAEKQLPAYWKAVSSGKNSDDIRLTCRACEHFVPMHADITVSLIGEKIDQECSLFLHTEKAVKMAESFGEPLSECEMASKTIDELRVQRQAEKHHIFEKIESQKGLDGMIQLFGKCIGCHGCRHVCPICHCVLCDFESHLFDSETEIIESELNSKGALRLPPDTILFQLGRLSHMSFSCVGCGMCTEVCPAAIPVASIFMRTGEETAQLFDYLPGRDVEEAVPITVYKEKELSTLGE